jgi:phospholipid/cholesterol/gamma-HCH transport system ATP-binding protein
MIKVENLSKSFGDRVVLTDINLEVKKGETLAVIGPSGCGKSTLLRILSGLDKASQGEVTLGSENYSFVFQYSALFDSLTVFENVAFSYMEKPDTAGVKHRSIPMSELKTLVKDTLGLLGLEDIEDLYPSQLSGGMQKRVSFARAVISRPDIIFYDEPTAGLDPIAVTATEDTIQKLQKELGATSIIVTHQLSTIENIANRIILLYDGHIQWQGTGKEFTTTDNPYAKQFATADLHGPMTDSVLTA